MMQLFQAKCRWFVGPTTVALVRPTVDAVRDPSVEMSPTTTRDCSCRIAGLVTSDIRQSYFLLTS